MTKAPVNLHDLRRKLYVKAKAEPSWRFWGLYVHVCKMETLQAAYDMAKRNDGAPGIDGVTFEAIEEQGAAQFLTRIQDELIRRTYVPLRARKKEIPKDGGKKVRVLSIPAIRDRVVQGALKLILEPTPRLLSWSNGSPCPRARAPRPPFFWDQAGRRRELRQFSGDGPPFEASRGNPSGRIPPTINPALGAQWPRCCAALAGMTEDQSIVIVAELDSQDLPQPDRRRPEANVGDVQGAVGSERHAGRKRQQATGAVDQNLLLAAVRNTK